MLKKISLSALFLTCFTFISCEKKESQGISPTYGSTGNPNPNAQTVTGTTTHSNPATENTSIYVGATGGWVNPNCGTTFSVALKALNGNTDVTISFASPAKTGTYVIASAPVANTSCALTVLNAPGQPAGIVWYGQSGSVAVNTTSASISASITNVVCVQKNFGFPSVTVNGVLGCSQ